MPGDVTAQGKVVEIGDRQLTGSKRLARFRGDQASGLVEVDDRRNVVDQLAATNKVVKDRRGRPLAFVAHDNVKIFPEPLGGKSSPLEYPGEDRAANQHGN